MVPTLSIVIMVINLLLGFAIPIGMMIFVRKNYHVAKKSFFLGCGVMLVFALILEQIAHMVILNSGAGTYIYSNAWLLALYGGIMAGLFEETGRFLAMRFLMKKKHANSANVLMYGAGHAGLETFYILVIGNISNLIYSLALNGGMKDYLMANVDSANQEALTNAFDTLINTASWQFVVSPIERVLAIAAQLGLSMIVWAAASKAKVVWKYYLLAILLHAVLDMVASYLSSIGTSIVPIELCVAGISVVIVVIAVLTSKKEQLVFEKED